MNGQPGERPARRYTMMKTLLVAVVVATQMPAPIFRFEADGFWLNLHHFLYVLARAQNGASDAKRAAVVEAPAEQAEGLKSLSDAERKTWSDAVTFYATGIGKLDMIFDDAMIDITNAMRVPPTASAKALKVDPALVATLERAAPIYRRVWWPKHQAANHARVREFAGLLEQHGDKVLAYLTRVYKLDWQKGGHPVNVSGWANWAGAYSSPRGNLIVVSSLDRVATGSIGLESIFHEGMHQWDDAMQARLDQLSKAQQTPRSRQGLTHALIWYTAAEAVRSAIPSHPGYADLLGMWNNQPNRSFKPALDNYWRQYLDGKITLDEALVGLLKS